MRPAFAILPSTSPHTNFGPSELHHLCASILTSHLTTVSSPQPPGKYSLARTIINPSSTPHHPSLPSESGQTPSARPSDVVKKSESWRPFPQHTTLTLSVGHSHLNSDS
ncbi:hypothetical protein ASPSYDRAFT_48172 [Aspergillus sydowii CBS 593.65]|uniref:Uncharacterized protein n=1 Tax=Aspergillus sydowii CBS 593.65 TaxID=1036612 RepID=A0A1L9T8Y9_9EURO|nr:uncharacterized protein ASPSYDRAFT_48172 [Aspergillus sydowii CBS 593.65]OJJ55897.1 hypothetical protein ASPSYDRAFT_48172 [Aspergillus sydowii CBS 593.65]